MTEAQLDSAIARFFDRGWRVLAIDGDSLVAGMPEEVAELGRDARLIRLEVRTFSREQFLAEIQDGAA